MNRPSSTLTGSAPDSRGLAHRHSSAYPGAAGRRYTRLIRLSTSVFLIMLFTLASSAQLQDEYKVKAAFVYNLTKYIEWPQPSKGLTIGFVGKGPIGELLRQMLEGKNTDSGPIQVLLSPSDEELVRCNLLFIAYASPKEIHGVLEKVRDKGILTVGDAEGFANQGGMVGLVRIEDRVQVQINLEATQAARFKISSRLLNVSTIVRSAVAEKK
jgi:hypothetical protein